MKKKNYQNPILQTVVLNSCDVIANSPNTPTYLFDGYGDEIDIVR